MWRDIYRVTLNPEIYIDAVNLRDLIAEAVASPNGSPADFLSKSLVQLCEYIEALACEQEEILDERLRATSYSPSVISTLFSHTAPFASALGVWLQGLSCPANFEDVLQLKALTLLADDVGVGQAETSRADAFRDIARRAGNRGSAVQARDLVGDRSLRDGVFRFPAILYGLSRRSEAFVCEIAGIDLALRVMGLHPVWRALSRAIGQPHWQSLDLALPCTSVFARRETPKSISREIAETLSAGCDENRRVRDGMVWAISALTNDVREFETVIAVSNHAAFAMADLIQQRSREAAVYHEDFKLEGKPLNVWFNEASIDPHPFLDALGRSSLVRPGQPERSLLLGPLLGPTGPMFRIFRTEDLETISRWISSLTRKDSAAISEPQQLAPEPGPRHNRPIEAGDLSLGDAPENVRDAYNLLQGRALPPRTRAFAREYVEFWLTVARGSIDKSERSLPDKWAPGALRSWLLDAHSSHAEKYRNAAGEALPSRREVIDQALQLAPLTLIDGGWIQGFTEVSYASSRVGAPLFQTYWDELGNGDWSINHPKIYRDLLASMDIVLPATGSREFAYDERLADASFRLPVFWLCAGKMPMSLRPEILGLNLAMELSGVGGSYRAARKFLKFYGFSTQFVDLHNTIDNVSTGHSAWAADAIESHLAAAGDFIDRAEEWKRVRTGYEALAPITRSGAKTDFFHHRRHKIANLLRRGAVNVQA
jgi:hypothetical protein